MKTVYIETSIISYLKARPARELIAAAWQSATNHWWDTQRGRFALFTSQLVVDEAGRGNAEMKPLMRHVCSLHGYPCPEICTPLELMGDNND
jgi:hypothetical protein